MGKASRDKGKVGERDLANTLKALGIDARRGVQHKGGPNSPDVIADIRGVHIECKRVEALSLYPALAQAADEAPEGAMAVVCHRRNKRDWVAILRLVDFVQLLKEAGRAGKPAPGELFR